MDAPTLSMTCAGLEQVGRSGDGCETLRAGMRRLRREDERGPVGYSIAGARHLRLATGQLLPAVVQCPALVLFFVSQRLEGSPCYLTPGLSRVQHTPGSPKGSFCGLRSHHTLTQALFPGGASVIRRVARLLLTGAVLLSLEHGGAMGVQRGRMRRLKGANLLSLVVQAVFCGPALLDQLGMGLFHGGHFTGQQLGWRAFKARRWASMAIRRFAKSSGVRFGMAGRPLWSRLVRG